MQAQPLEVSLFGGAAVDLHQASFSQLGSFASCCPEFSGGTGLGVWLGAGLALPLSSQWRVIPRLVYAAQNGTMTYDEHSVVADLRGTPTIRDATFRHELESTITSIGLEPMLAFRPFGGLDLLLGFRLAYVTAANFKQTETLVEPEDYGTYLGAGRTWVNHDADIPGATTVAAAAIGGLRYSIPLTTSGNVLLNPELSYVLPITGVADGTDWTIHDIRFGIGVSYAILPAPEPPADSALPNPAPVPVARSVPPPVVSVRVFPLVNQVEQATELDTIRVEETLIVDFLPVLGHVYFDLGSKVVPQRYVEHGRKAADSLEQLTPEEAATGVLGAVARRMLQEASSSIMLVGSTSDMDGDKDLELARSRAEAVKAQMVAFGVHPSRITIKAQRLPVSPTTASDPRELPLAQAENRRVEIVTESTTLLSPLVLSTVQTTVEPESLAIHSSASSSASISELELDFSGSQASTSWRSVTSGTLRIPSPRSTDTVIAVATDTLNQMASASSPLPVSVLTAQRKRTERRGDAEVERYSLILFAFDDATVTNEHRQVLERIRTRMREGARVRILGMTDVMGASDYNLNLSRRRAEEVARALGLDKSVIEAVGARQPRFDNAAPEGRAYNRTVVIEVRSAK
jgi:outer membrane protein OmpA-like peptidoglycan-associated protein